MTLTDDEEKVISALRSNPVLSTFAVDQGKLQSYLAIEDESLKKAITHLHYLKIIDCVPLEGQKPYYDNAANISLTSYGKDILITKNRTK